METRCTIPAQSKFCQKTARWTLELNREHYLYEFILDHIDQKCPVVLICSTHKNSILAKIAKKFQYYPVKNSINKKNVRYYQLNEIYYEEQFMFELIQYY